ncbi:hypothetical protein CH333_01655 [candidate division WOR-3 bacterium JGI_Cruoil_03_44_89]|uniref:DUF4382 domain-containing protein n=1 Tax=candidate division WOR-3 bacterium JGI_Cruoil_03_44_89 TaxID=1973748 RepID=A0A235BXW4_UNCW3|nr:MAG: hypothetical protein CH333_01655 [candidate division WOR-3 bacterium JGI_Cruoil_03_44_89]
MRKYFIILLSLVLLSCFNQHPQAPEWDVDITIPLVKERYPVVNIVDTLDPSVGIRIGEDSIMQLYLKVDIDTFSIDESLRLGDIDTLVARSIGDVWIANMDTGNISVSAREIAESGAGIGIPDTPFVADFVPPFSYTTSFKSDTFDMIDSVCFSVVCFTVRILNQTGMSFDSVTFIPVSGLEVDPITYVQMPNNSARDTSLYLENAVVRGYIRTQLRFTVLDTLFEVPFSLDDSVSFSVILDSVRIGSGRVKIPSFTDSVDYVFKLPFVSDYSLKLDSVIFSRGGLYIDIDNGLPIGGRLTADIAELDTSFVLSIFPHAPSTGNMDLAGITYDNTSSPSESTLLTTRITVAVDSSDDFVDITADDGITVGIVLQMMDYSLIAGKILEPITHQIDYTLEIPVDYSDIGCIRLAESRLYVDVWSTIGFSSGAIGSITGRNSYSQSVSIPFSLSVDAGTPRLPPSHGEASCDLAPLLNILPEEITISGEVSLDEGSGILERGSYITGRVYNETPFRAAFTCDTIHFDTVEVKIEDEDVIDALSHIQSVALQVDVKNHFPFGFDCDFMVINPKGSDSLIKRLTIPPAPVDQNGIAIAPNITTVKIALDSLEFDILQNPPFSTFAVLYVPETDTITVHARDYLEFGGYCVAKVRVKE